MGKAVSRLRRVRAAPRMEFTEIFCHHFKGWMVWEGRGGWRIGVEVVVPFLSTSGMSASGEEEEASVASLVLEGVADGGDETPAQVPDLLVRIWVAGLVPGFGGGGEVTGGRGGEVPAGRGGDELPAPVGAGGDVTLGGGLGAIFDEIPAG